VKRRVVITGLGVVTSLSCQVEDLFSRILKCESGIHLLKIFDTSQFSVRIGGDVWDWNPVSHIDFRELKRLDRFSQFALFAAQEAVSDSGIDFNNEQLHRCGVALGSAIGGLNEVEEQLRRMFNKGPERVSPTSVPRLMHNAASSNISIRFGVRGPSTMVITACASANHAMGEAFRLIQRGSTELMISGGSDAGITQLGLASFQNMKALSPRNEEPHRASRPFDRQRDGFVISEGAGIVIMEELAHAQKRGARIYCEVLGFGDSCDAGHITHPDSEGVGAAYAMKSALDDAGLPLDAVDYINAHGTSTQLGDKAETVAIKRVFGALAKKISISSTKSQLGHSLGASGGIELVLTAKVIQQQIAPPTANLENPDPECDLDYTPLNPKERKIDIALSNSFGFGGHNATLLVGKLRT
jgi:3-oxoacyl-[acyl-carrier-protein] synthase II